MKVRAIHCHNCKDIVYSRAQEDYRECGCGLVNTWGGQTFTNFDAIPDAEYDILNLNIDATSDDMYVDWLEMDDKHGIVRSQEKNYQILNERIA